MNAICINTSFNNTYVAVKKSDVVACKTVNSSLKQSENLLGVIDDCLNQAQLNLKDVDVISCVIGPGSFTGIRIGASMAKGFCFAMPRIKKVQINSLDLLAYAYAKNNLPNTDYWVVLNALSGNLFACKYNSQGKNITEHMLVFGQELEQITGVVVGLKSEEISLCNSFADFSCEDLLEYTLNKANDGEYSNDFIPLYLRKSQAEAEFDKKNLKKN